MTTTPRTVGGKILNEVKSTRKPDLSVFSKQELSLINEVCRELGRKTAAVLSDMSHDEPAWHYAGIMGKLSPELMAYGHTEDPDGL